MATRTLQDVLLYECRHGTQRSVAVLYAMSISEFLADVHGCKKPICSVANNAILERWGSVKALRRIKKMAWDIHDDLAKEG